MSERNGDRARFNKERRKNALRRKLNRALLTPNAVMAVKPKAVSSELKN